MAPSGHLSVRKATMLDLDDMVDIALAAMPMDPQWNYRFPHQHQYPEDTRAFTRLKYHEFLADKLHWEVRLLRLTDRRGKILFRPIAFSVWEVANLYGSPSQQPNAGPKVTSPNRPRLDGSASRMAAWAAAMKASKTNLFDDTYGKRHLHLQILAVRPEWQRCGAGTALCSWGIKAAKENKMALSVFASPMGQRLYLKLGFRDVGGTLVQVEGEEEYVRVAALAYEPQEYRKRSISSANVPSLGAAFKVRMTEVAALA